MPAPKPEARAQAVALRLQGWSYSQILEVVDASPGSLSLWLRDVPLTDEQRAALAKRNGEGVRRAAVVNRSRRVERQRAIEDGAAAEIGPISARELFLVGVGLYRAEGCKAKPWSVSTGVTLTNSDPTVVQLFLAWLRLLGIGDDEFSVRVAIHESADVAGATAFWAAATGVCTDRFLRPTLKRHNPKTVRRNVGERYVGCLVVRVRRSTELNRRIAGWWAGIVGGIEVPER
jgi:hypothetical protein